MTRLSDLVHRSALRNRSAGDAEVGGSSAQVFEVTDLTIPAGTDWSAHGGPSLGSFTILPVSMVQAKFSIEFAPGTLAQLTDTQDTIDVTVDETGDWATSETAWSLGANAGGPSGAGLKESLADTVWSTASEGPDQFGQVVPDIVPSLLRGFGSGPIPDPFTLHIYLRTTAPTHHDAHIVRARAAFLVI